MRIVSLPSLTRHFDFIGAVFALVSGKSMAALIALVLTPIIARLYEPVDFGVFAILAALVTPLSTIGTLRLDLALVVADGVSAARRLLVAAIKWLLLVCLLLMPAMALLANVGFGVRLGLAPGMHAWLLIVPLLVLVDALGTFANGWLTREGIFGPMARAEVARSATTGAGRLGIGAAFGSSVAGLAAGYAAGSLVQLGLLWRHVPGATLREVLRRPWRERLREIAAYRDFPLFNASTGLLMALSLSVPVVALGIIYDAAVVGAYAMTVRLIGAGGNLVAMSVQRVYLQRVARIRDAGRSMFGAWTKTTAILVLLGALPLALLVLYGREIFGLLLGPGWGEAGRYAEVVSVLLFTHWIATPSMASIIVLRRQHLLLASQFVVLFGQIGVFVLVRDGSVGPVTTIAALVAVQVAADTLRIALGGWLAWRNPPPRPQRARG